VIVTVEELKMHLHVQHDEEDSLIESLIRQAQASAEDICRVSFADADAPEPVRLAVILMASHYYERRDNADKAAYTTMYTAFRALLSPYSDPAKMF